MKDAKFDDIEYKCVSRKNGVYAPPCDNCKHTFSRLKNRVRAENSEVLWNEYYGTSSGAELPWDKIGTGEKREKFVRNTVRKYL